MITNISEIESIKKYSSIYELVKENKCTSFWIDGKLDDDDICFLRHYDDYQEFTYFVINWDYVMIAVDDNVNGNLILIEEFLTFVENLLQEDRVSRA